MAHPGPRWALCLSGFVVAACAVGGSVWYAARPADPPPPPTLPSDGDGEESADPGPTLPEPERAFIWEAEHRGNVLNAYGFKRLAAALRDADPDAVTRLLADDFTGELPREPGEVRLRTGSVDVLRRDDAGRAPTRVGRGEFVAQLLEYRRAFTGTPPGIQFALKSILPKSREYADGPWVALAVMRLYGESSPGQPCEVVATFRVEVACPTRETLARPGWLRAAGLRQSLVARASHYLMADVTRERGLDPSLFHDNWLEDPDSPSSRLIATGGVFVCDFDRDGVLDLLVADVKRYALYKGLPGGKFVDVTEQVGLPRTPSNRNALSNVACWVDVDGDGWEDLVLGERVFRNEGGKRFADHTAWTDLRLPPDTMSLAVADFDRDGRLDLYATRTGTGRSRSWLSGRSGLDAGNRLFRNKGGWKFEDVTERSGAGGGRRSSFTAAWLDANNDGWPDLHVVNEFGNGVLLENRGDGTFRERALGPGPVDFGTMGVAAGDVDNDGNIDLYCANMYSKAGSRIIGNLRPGTYPDDVMARLRRFVAGSQLHLNRGGFRFEQAGERMQVNAVGWAYGPALADLDNDGWLDVYATCGQISRDRNKPDG